jgi:hypothetical protein
VSGARIAEPGSCLEVLVEVPKGSRNKHELEVNGAIYLDPRLFTATQYPADYGFVIKTLSEDGDSLDTLVLLEEVTLPGCHVRVRPVAVFSMSDEASRDPKLLCVPATESALEARARHRRPRSLLARRDRPLLHGLQAARAGQDNIVLRGGKEPKPRTCSSRRSGADTKPRAPSPRKEGTWVKPVSS